MSCFHRDRDCQFSLLDLVLPRKPSALTLLVFPSFRRANSRLGIAVVLEIPQQARAILLKSVSCKRIFASQTCEPGSWIHSSHLPLQDLGAYLRIACKNHSPHRNVWSIMNFESHFDRRLRGCLPLYLHPRIRMTQIRQGKLDLLANAMQRDHIFRLTQFELQFFLREYMVDLLPRKESRTRELHSSKKRKFRQIKCKPQLFWRST